MIGRAATLAITLLGASATTLRQLDDRPPWLVWNASASVPIGLYAVHTVIALHVGDLVVVRPPERVARFLADDAYLPRGVPLLKHVAALGRQTVCRIDHSITVDTIEMGEARERDSRGRPLPDWQGCRAIAKGEVFLMNRKSPDSLDGRYFGPPARRLNRRPRDASLDQSDRRLRNDHSVRPQINLCFFDRRPTEPVPCSDQASDRYCAGGRL
jgi:conjugative transfer signal peptidase TraF